MRQSSHATQVIRLQFKLGQAPAAAQQFRQHLRNYKCVLLGMLNRLRHSRCLHCIPYVLLHKRGFWLAPPWRILMNAHAQASGSAAASGWRGSSLGVAVAPVRRHGHAAGPGAVSHKLRSPQTPTTNPNQTAVKSYPQSYRSWCQVCNVKALELVCITMCRLQHSLYAHQRRTAGQGENMSVQARRQEDERLRELARAGPLQASGDLGDAQPVVAQACNHPSLAPLIPRGSE